MDFSDSRSAANAATIPPTARSRRQQARERRATETPPPDSGETFWSAPDERKIVTLAGLTKLAATYLPAADVRRIREAYRYSDAAHLGQFRSSGEPYISHPIAVAEICALWKLDADTLMAALLHDVIEDSGAQKEDLVTRFGPEVAELVDGLSKFDRVEFASREHQQAESFRKMLLAMARDVRVILVKLADRLHNMRTLGAVSRDKQRRVARETLEIYAPIANRLGLHKLYNELLDLSFGHQFPWRSKVIGKAVLASRGNRREMLGKVLETVQKKLPEMGVNAEVFGREKTLYGVYRKMRDKRLSFSQVLDIYAFRVIVEDVPACYVALGALHGSFKPVPGRFKDYIAIPKVNGYQSLHTTLVGPHGTPVEFQIRTREMQRINESGVAAHWLYKADKESFSELQMRTHQWLKSLLDIQHQTGDSLEFIENVKVDLFPDAVYVFTPQGQIRALPRGATVIDFAYTVHTDIGDTAVGARINQRSMPLRTELQNGDTVEVVTDPKSHPNPAWLSFVRTGKARAEIRHYLKTVEFGESVELGRRLLEQSLAAVRIDAGSLEPTLLERAARDCGTRSIEDLYAEIGLGKRLAPVVARTVALQIAGRPAAALAIPRPAPIMVHGTEGSAVQYGPCCHPLPGDGVIGHMRGGHGLMVHRDDCASALRLRGKDAERWIEVEWAEDITGLFRVSVELLVADDRGLLGRVAAEIAACEANIVHVAMNEDAGTTANLKFTVQVHDRQHLARVMRRLRAIAQVRRIWRS